MSTIKNIHILDLVIPEEDKSKLDAAAEKLRVQSNITFKILEVDEKRIVVRVKQDKHAAEKYIDKKELVTIGRDLFEKFFPAFRIHPQAIAYTPNPVSEIDAGWIKKQMDKHNVRVMDIVQDTGVDKTNVSAWTNATRPMSQPVKAMFYYYFKCKS